MYHLGLIKILIEFHHKSLGDTWENFIIGNHFQGDQEQPSCSKEKRGRKIKVENEQPLQEQLEDEIPISKLLGKFKQQVDKKKVDSMKGKEKVMNTEKKKNSKSSTVSNKKF